MNSEQLIIAVGHKARHGKDTFANVAYNALDGGVFITHWADPLKEEVSNSKRILPLIYRNNFNGTIYYNLLNKEGSHYRYEVKSQTSFPQLHLLFEKKKIDIYWGMDEKDSEMLQIWGTDYRRAQNPNYWVERTEEVFWHRHEKYIIIPDTRFENEYKKVKELNGLYVNVLRLNEDNTLYKDPSRDPTHLSEVNLDGVEADFTIKEYSGNMVGLTQKIIDVLNIIKGA